jgi:hypothetical protein
MLVAVLSFRKLGNLWKDNFDCSVVYIVKGTSNSSGCVAQGIQSVLTFSLHFVQKVKMSFVRFSGHAANTGLAP